MFANFPRAGPDLDRADIVAESDGAEIVDITINTVATTVITAMLEEHDIG